MPRKVIPIVAGEIYHVFNRGVDKRSIFLDKQDYLRFYQSLHIFNSVDPAINFMFARDHEETRMNPLVEMQAYSLLPNHFHFLIKTHTAVGLSEYMKRLTGGYTSYFNERYERSGSLFQGTFKRVHVESDEQYRYLFAYVNENHYVHGIIRPNEIMYSSSLHYQKRAYSKIIQIHSEYNVADHQKLAEEIHGKRLLSKAMGFD